MRKVLILFIIASCSSHAPKKIDTSSIDSAINSNQSSIRNINEVSAQTESKITTKIDNAAKTITNLKEEVKVLKNENKALKSIINSSNDAGKPFELRPISNN